jgi:cytochrome oxidase Cu insertion factor (SCO1/SenC/PrrC family)
VVNLQQRIEKLKNTVYDDDEKLCRLYFVYRRKMNISHDEMMEEPIPTVLSNLEFLEEEAKAEQEAMKKSRKGGK